jgi:hypothetical protein
MGSAASFHGNAVEAIREALSTGPKTPEELKEVVTKRGIARSTYQYNLRQMIKRGEIAETKYSSKGERVSDAIAEELLNRTAETDAQRIELSKDLEFLSRKPGIAMKGQFLSKIEECLHSQLSEVRKFSLLALNTTLWILQDDGYEEDKTARQRIRERFYELIANLAKSDTDLSVRADAIKTLAELGDFRAIAIILEIVNSASEQEYQVLKDPIRYAIVWKYMDNRRPKNYLTREYHHKILIALSDLASKGNQRASELATELRRGV